MRDYKLVNDHTATDQTSSARSGNSRPLPYTAARLRDWWALFALVVAWGSSFLLTDIALTAYSPSVIVAGRIFVGAALLMAVVIASGRRLPRSGRQWSVILLMALLGNALPFSLVAWGQQTVPSGLAGILMAVMPLFVMMLAHRFDNDRMTSARAAGLVLGFGGVILLLGPAVTQEGTGSVSGQVAILAAAVCYGINIMLARLLSGTPALVAAASVMLMANVLILPIAAPDVSAAAPSLPATLALVALGVFSTALGSLLYFRLVATAGPVFLSLINYLIPVWAVIVGTIFLDERLPDKAFVALTLILGGILISQYRRRIRPTPQLVGEG